MTELPTAVTFDMAVLAIFSVLLVQYVNPRNNHQVTHRLWLVCETWQPFG